MGGQATELLPTCSLLALHVQQALAGGPGTAVGRDMVRETEGARLKMSSPGTRSRPETLPS